MIGQKTDKELQRGDELMSWGQLKKNSCLRCKGTMFQDRDRFGKYLQCLQCGNIVDLDVSTLANRGDLLAKLEKRTGTKVNDRDKDAIGTR